MPQPDPQRLLAGAPFSGVAELVSLGPLADGTAHSGGAFRAEAADGTRFKLRVCRSERRAREIEAALRALPEYFPALVAREGRLLLLEFLDGESLADRKQLRPHAHHLGRFYARVHESGELSGLRRRFEAARIRFQVERHLRALRRLDPELARPVAERCRQWRRRHGIPIGLELRDVHKANFMLDREGRLRFVDEDGLMYAMRGMGLGKLLADGGSRPGSPKRTREWYAFCEGYAEVGDASFLTPEYSAYARVLELVRSVEFKLRRDERVHKVDDELAELREWVGPGVKRPPLPADDDFGLKREPAPRELDEPS